MTIKYVVTSVGLHYTKFQSFWDISVVVVVFFYLYLSYVMGIIIFCLNFHFETKHITLNNNLHRVDDEVSSKNRKLSKSKTWIFQQKPYCFNEKEYCFSAALSWTRNGSGSVNQISLFIKMFSEYPICHADKNV